MRKLRKKLAIFLVILLILGRFSPLFVLAEELDETNPTETEQTETQQTETVDPSVTDPELSPSPEVEIDNEAEVANEVESTAISGENSIEEPTPTPSSEPALESETESTEEPEITPEVTPSPTPEATPAAIKTGDAVSVAEVENSVNSTEVNSQVLYQTLNIFTAGDIDLTTTPLAIAEDVFQNNNDPVVNVAVIDNQNFAYLSNDIVSLANTGENTIDGAQEAIINTGDAYSIVSLLNKVNTTIIDSTIHLVTINIFGNVQGNIILPEFSSSSGDGCCGEVIQTESAALVENKVNSAAISGQNSITSTDTENASINTGSANSAVNLVNIVNTNLIGVVFRYLFVNTFGTWLGNFLGWDNFAASPGGGNLSLNSIDPGNGNNASCPTCFDQVLLNNEAQLVNNVSSTANTGGNSINGGQASINTGNAYSAVSMVNFVNTSVISSLGFFGFVNIFGFLDGDIGGASLFATSEPEPEPEAENTTNQESGPSVREAGGQLEVYQTTNVGTHVLPGDTITFFITVKNPGTGRVYDTKLRIDLMNDGLAMGGAIFELGDIEAGRGVKVTTGLVLSKDAEPGDYIAHTVASGYVGPDDNLISGYADSSFRIAGGFLPLVSGISEEVQAAETEGETLGGMVTNKGLTKEQKLGLLLIGSLVVYLAVNTIKERRKWAIAWSHRRSFLNSKSAELRAFVMKLSSFLS